MNRIRRMDIRRLRYPWITTVAYTSEVADETAQGGIPEPVCAGSCGARRSDNTDAHGGAERYGLPLYRAGWNDFDQLHTKETDDCL